MKIKVKKIRKKIKMIKKEYFLYIRKNGPED